MVRRVGVLVASLSVAALVAATLASCAASSANRGVADPLLRGNWILTSASDANGLIELSETTVTLQVSTAVVGTGRAICGDYRASLFGTTAHVRIVTAGGTSGCPNVDEARARERYLAALGSSTHAVVGAGTLELDSANTSLQYLNVAPVSPALLGTRTWNLGSVNTTYAKNDSYVPVASGASFRLEDASHFSGTTGCRPFSGTYRYSAGRFIILSTQATGGDCTGEQNIMDDTVLAVFTGSFTVLQHPGVIVVANQRVGIGLLFGDS
jgi:heat shock protein HslJ